MFPGASGKVGKKEGQRGEEEERRGKKRGGGGEGERGKREEKSGEEGEEGERRGKKRGEEEGRRGDKGKRELIDSPYYFTHFFFLVSSR